jgi:hypothetical protein
MANITDEFDEFLQKQRREDEFSPKEQFLIEQLDIALTFLKQSNVFLETWYKESHAGTGYGAKALKDRIDLFIRSFESEENKKRSP